jgi:hypothetical protein
VKPNCFSIISNDVLVVVSQHYHGLHGKQRAPMPFPRFLVVYFSAADSAFFLYRYTLEGEIAGDTWHQTRKDAQRQAEFEYGDALQVTGWSSPQGRMMPLSMPSSTWRIPHEIHGGEPVPPVVAQMPDATTTCPVDGSTMTPGASFRSLTHWVHSL